MLIVMEILKNVMEEFVNWTHAISSMMHAYLWLYSRNTSSIFIHRPYDRKICSINVN